MQLQLRIATGFARACCELRVQPQHSAGSHYLKRGEESVGSDKILIFKDLTQNYVYEGKINYTFWSISHFKILFTIYFFATSTFYTFLALSSVFTHPYPRCGVAAIPRVLQLVRTLGSIQHHCPFDYPLLYVAKLTTINHFLTLQAIKVREY